MEYIFEYQMEVRDYECDIQGIVNNAVYQNYLEHARHQFLNELDLNFIQLHKQGLDGVVTRIAIDYKNSLRPADKFVVKNNIRKQGNVRFVFDQAIYRISDNKLIIKAEVTGVLTQKGRPIPPRIFDEALARKGFAEMQ